VKREVRLWINLRNAEMITLENDAEVIRKIKSNIEKRVRFSSDTHSKVYNNSQGATAEDIRDRQFGDHLGRNSDGIVPIIRDADSILIFGPGEAKVELEDHLKRENLGEHIVGIETVDMTTNHQITAKAQNYFLE
jgi:stalled ribosome rescue protein Dom34